MPSRSRSTGLPRSYYNPDRLAQSGRKDPLEHRELLAQKERQEHKVPQEQLGRKDPLAQKGRQERKAPPEWWPPQSTTH